MKRNIFDRRSECCYIELQPFLNKDNGWTGQVEVNILTSQNNPMDLESRKDLLHLCQLVASTVALMEQDVELADRLEDFVNEKEEHEPACEKKKVDITHEDGNVIHLSFKTNTKGSA
tara:strand:- start:457 stop:807 length:351 start_codon:yes stop_codon:yes gene_type:complete